MKGLQERVQQAVETDNTIITSRDNIDPAAARTPEQMEYLGLSKRDLKWLERNGLAVRAYTANGYMHYFENEQGKLQQRRFGPGSRVKWLLLTPKEG